MKKIIATKELRIEDLLQQIARGRGQKRLTRDEVSEILTSANQLKMDLSPDKFSEWKQPIGIAIVLKRS